MRHKILIVEDDADLRRALVVRLKKQGYEVVVAGDGVSAISVARAEVPDLVLLDLGLPAGNGFKVMEWLKQLPTGGRAPVIVASARDSAQDRKRALEMGVVAFLSKPLDNDLLLGTIARELRAQGEAVAGSPRFRCLIVEDDGDTRLGLQLRLQASGYETTTAADATTAFTRAVREKPNVILLDLGLPGGDGLVLLDRILKHPVLAGIPVIVVSARDAAVHGPRALAAGATAYLQKPVNNEKLLAAIEGALEEGSFPG